MEIKKPKNFSFKKFKNIHLQTDRQYKEKEILRIKASISKPKKKSNANESKGENKDVIDI